MISFASVLNDIANILFYLDFAKKFSLVVMTGQIFFGFSVECKVVNPIFVRPVFS